jgi:hypothetical protein
MEFDKTLPCSANVHHADPNLTTPPACLDVDKTILFSKYAINGRAKAN